MPLASKLPFEPQFWEGINRITDSSCPLFSGVLNINPLAPFQPLVNVMLNDSSQIMRLQFECKMLCGQDSKSNPDISLAAE